MLLYLSHIGLIPFQWLLTSSTDNQPLSYITNPLLKIFFISPPTILNLKNLGVYVFLSPSPITHISCSPRQHHVCLWAIPQPRMRINVLIHKPINYIYLGTFCLTKVKPILSSIQSKHRYQPCPFRMRYLCRSHFYNNHRQCQQEVTPFLPHLQVTSSTPLLLLFKICNP